MIPSHARPNDLCLSTLTFLRKHGVDLSRVHVFVDFAWSSACGTRAYDLYVKSLRQHGFHAVHVRPGGRGLEGNMKAIRELFDIGTYVITMSDRVDDLLELTAGTSKNPTLTPVPAGALASLWHHGHDVIKAGGFAAWSTNASHSARTMRQDALSRKAGLLDGNMTGQLVTQDWKDMTVDHGLIYDVEYAACLWTLGHGYVRYRMLCCKHPYRSRGGQAERYSDPAARRQTEDAAIKSVAAKYPDVLMFVSKPNASLKVMNYAFRRHGPSVLKVIQRHGQGAGRNRKYSNDRAATPQERTAACRARQKRKRKRA